MESKGLWKGLTSGANALYAIVGVILAILMLLIFGFIMVGSFTYQVEQGNIPVTNQTNTSVQSVEDNLETARGTVSTNLTTILGFVALVVIMAIMVGVGFKLGKGGSGGKADF